jgi:hypothetical protein
MQRTKRRRDEKKLDKQTNLDYAEYSELSDNYDIHKFGDFR